MVSAGCGGVELGEGGAGTGTLIDGLWAPNARTLWMLEGREGEAPVAGVPQEQSEGVRSAGAGEAQEERQPEERPSGNSVRNWPFRPASVRLHPLSRFLIAKGSEPVPSTLARSYEARLEFRDRYEHPTKGMGRVTFVLCAGRLRPEGEIPRDRTVATWTADLADLEVNQKHYDDITRTYVFQLELKPELGAAGVEMTLRATYEPAGEPAGAEMAGQVLLVFPGGGA